MVYMTYHSVKIKKILMCKIWSKFLDVVLKAPIISACLSSESDKAVNFNKLSLLLFNLNMCFSNAIDI